MPQSYPGFSKEAAKKAMKTETWSQRAISRIGPPLRYAEEGENYATNLYQAADNREKGDVGRTPAQRLKSQTESYARRTAANPSLVGNMKKGGRVKKTGNYKLHKGEHVFSRDQVRDMARNLQM